MRKLRAILRLAQKRPARRKGSGLAEVRSKRPGDLEFEVAGRAREGDDVSDIGDAGQHHEQALKA